MTPPARDLWVRIDAALDALFDAPAADRPSLQARLVAADPQLEPHLQRLLRADSAPVGPLDAGVAGRDLEPLAGLDPPSPPPRRVGRYRILRELGRGGMGTVYLGERDDGEFRQTVAVKVLKRGMDTDEILRRFLRERQILARLEHPGIARLIDGGATEDGRPYFVMEFVDGEPLTTFADRRRLSLRARLALFDQVCDAATFAQHHLVVHRDLKPANILVTEAGRVTLLDFGIAKLLTDADDDRSLVTAAEVRLLTPAYAAPEQLRGEPVTTATDVYALGIILYELLAGQHPFRAPQTARAGGVPDRTLRPMSQVVTTATASARRTNPRALRRQLRGDLATIVARALREEPDLRYATAADLRNDLDRFRRGRPVTARPASSGYRLRKYLRRHRLELAATTAVTLALLSGLVGTAWQARVAAREAARANEVKTFLLGLFEAADPDAAPGTEPSVTDLLRQGRERIDREFAQDPATRADIYTLLGNLHEALGDYDEARPLLERSLALQRGLRGEDAPEVRSALYELGSLAVRAAAYPRADSLLSEALARFERDGNRDSKELVDLYNDLGVLQSRLGDHTAAEASYRRSLAMCRRLFGDDDPEVATGLDNLGALLAEDRRGEEAEPLLREALAIRRRHLAPDHSAIATSLHNLAFAVSQLGRPEEAEALYREAIGRRRLLFPDGHPLLAGTLREYGRLLLKLDRLDEAEAYFGEAIAMYQRFYQDEHVDTAMARNELALVAYRRGDYERAASDFATALEIFEHLLPDDHPTLLTVENNIAGSFLRAGRLAEANAHYRHLLARRHRCGAARDPLGPKDLVNAGRALRLGGDLAAAAPVLREALARRRQDPGATAVDIADAGRELGLVLAGTGDRETARALLESAVAAYAADLPPDEPRLIEARAALSRLGG